jgi:hypothetical protein
MPHNVLALLTDANTDENLRKLADIISICDPNRFTRDGDPCQSAEDALRYIKACANNPIFKENISPEMQGILGVYINFAEREMEQFNIATTNYRRMRKFQKEWQRWNSTVTARLRLLRDAIRIYIYENIKDKSKVVDSIVNVGHIDKESEHARCIYDLCNKAADAFRKCNLAYPNLVTYHVTCGVRFMAMNHPKLKKLVNSLLCSMKTFHLSTMTYFNKKNQEKEAYDFAQLKRRKAVTACYQVRNMYKIIMKHPFLISSASSAAVVPSAAAVVPSAAVVVPSAAVVVPSAAADPHNCTSKTNFDRDMEKITNALTSVQKISDTINSDQFKGDRNMIKGLKVYISEAQKLMNELRTAIEHHHKLSRIGGESDRAGWKSEADLNLVADAIKKFAKHGLITPEEHRVATNIYNICRNAINAINECNFHSADLVKYYDTPRATLLSVSQLNAFVLPVIDEIYNHHIIVRNYSKIKDQEIAAHDNIKDLRLKAVTAYEQIMQMYEIIISNSVSPSAAAVVAPSAAAVVAPSAAAAVAP